MNIMSEESWGRVSNLDILTQASVLGGVIDISDWETSLDRSDAAAAAIDL